MNHLDFGVLHKLRRNDQFGCAPERLVFEQDWIDGDEDAGVAREYLIYR